MLIVQLKKITGVLFILLLSACTRDKVETSTVYISAASSLIDVLDDVIDEFKKEYKTNFEVNYASSSICARQIKEGKRTSLFLSANIQWTDYLHTIATIENPRVFLKNELVVVSPLDSKININTLEDLLHEDIKCIAMGDPNYVPAGIYGREILEQQDLWSKLKGKVVGAFDVRAALSLVEMDSVQCAIVYKTDAMSSTRVKTELSLPKGKNNIEYYVSLFENGEKSLLFYNFLFSEKSRNLFEAYGFKHESKDD